MKQSNTPKHVAIIMDGNGRWAKQRSRPRVFGHIRGAKLIKPLVTEAQKLGIQSLTLYAFSTENWGRPEEEKSVLWKLLIKFLKKEAKELHRNNVQLNIFGQIDKLGTDVRAVLDPTLALLSQNTGLKLNFAVSYGSRQEILKATQDFAQACVDACKDALIKSNEHSKENNPIADHPLASNQGTRLSPANLTEELFESYLWTAPLQSLSDVDLVIRTSGEIRVSNFLLWQAAYAEYLFLDKNWPDFTVTDLQDAVLSYSKRNRRFGMTQEQILSKSTN